jgi:hypothetical protein
MNFLGLNNLVGYQHAFLSWHLTLPSFPGMYVNHQQGILKITQYSLLCAEFFTDIAVICKVMKFTALLDLVY